MLTEAGRDAEVHYGFESESDKLSIRARGLAAHSSKPWDGRNAITHLAGTLGSVDWPDTQAARMVRLINDLVGTGDYAEKFGDVAYSDSFMGPRTLSLTMLKREDGNLVAGINIRQPVGRSEEQVKRTIGDALTAWSQETGIRELRDSLIIGAPHIPVLLEVFQFYTGRTDARPISIGGGTHARLVPNGVNFGPAMPGE